MSSSACGGMSSKPVVAVLEGKKPLFFDVKAFDATYNRGEVKVILANLGTEPFEIRRGERIAQLVPAPVLKAGFREVESLDETQRGAGGFGSTGR